MNPRLYRTFCTALFLILTQPGALGLTVTTTLDELNVPAGANISLREAIRDTAAGGTVDFDASLNGADLLLTLGEFDIAKNLTIDATGLSSGLTLYGSNNTIFRITAGTINLKGLTLTFGKSITDGGAIHLSGGSILTITDSIIKNCVANNFGGAIYCNASTLNLINTNIENNSSLLEAGGAIYSTGASSSTTLTGCTLRNNSAPKHGGAIRSNGAGTVTLTDSNLIGNSGLFGGGLSKGNGTLTVTGCAIAYNSATTAGGGIYIAGVNATITNSTFGENQAMDGGGGLALNNSSTATLESTTTSRNKAVNNGGGIIVRLSTLNIANSIVAQNHAGGSTDIHHASGTITPSQVNIIGSNDGTDTAFPSGSPNTNGDLVGTDTSPTDAQLSTIGYFGGVTMTMHPLAGSPAIEAGGVTALSTDQRGYGRVVGASVDIGAVELGPVKIVTTADDENDGSLGLGTGDSLRECIDDITTPGSRIVFSAGMNGATIQLINGFFLISGKNILIDASAMTNGVTIDADNLSHFFTVSGSDSLALESLTLIKGQRASSGGAISVNNGARFHASNCTFDQCIVTGVSQGGALYFSGSFGTIHSCNFTSNTALNGGAVSIFESHLDMSHSSFSQNLAGGTGSTTGGALRSFQSTFAISHSSFLSNNASGTLGGMGGAIYYSNALSLAPSHSQLINCTFQGNLAIQGGGIVVNGILGNLLLRHLTLTTNSADSGGGMYIRKAGLSTDSVTFDHCLIAGNSAPFYGDIQYDTSGGGAGQILTPGANLIGNNHSIDAIFPAGPLVGTQVAPIDALFGTAGLYTGATTVIPLLAGSPAIDAGSSTVTTPYSDQRDLGRNQGGAPDLGAYETGNIVGYTTWTLETIPTGMDSGFDEDSELDKLFNGLEYATNRIPTAIDSHDLLSIVRMPKTGGGYEMHLTFPYQPDAPDLKYIIERNSDLMGFSNRYTLDLSTLIELLAPGGLVTATIDEDNQTITVVDADIGINEMYFWRLRVELLP